MGPRRPASLPAISIIGMLAALLLPGTLAAAPIQPDVEKLVQEAQQPSPQFAPARAGWYGPEIGAGAVLAPSLALDAAYQARLARAALLQAALPDPRIAAALLVLIVLLRRLHHRPRPGPKLLQQPASPPPGEEPELRQAA
jgi:hypothetical protein